MNLPALFAALVEAAPLAVKGGKTPPGKWKMFLNTLVAWGPGGLFVLAALDSAGIPIVGGVDLLLVNVAAARPDLAYWSALCAVAGSLVGCAVLFGLARKGGEIMLGRHIRSGLGARMHAWFEQYGLITVFIPALSPLPLPMKVPVFCAGALEVRASRFFLVVAAARAIRYLALAYFGARYGAQTLLFLRAHIRSVALAAVLLAAVAAIGMQLRNRQLRRARESGIAGTENASA